MQLFPKTSAELVIDLITASNSSLPFPLTTTSAYVGPPTVIPVVAPSIANTSARLSSKPGSGYIGSKVVQYRRVNLTDLFKNVTPNIRKYSAAGEVGNYPFTIYNILPFLNDIYGLKLTTDDVNDASFPAYSTITEGGVSKKVSSVTMTAKATSTAYTGSVLIRTQAGQRELSSAITKGELTGRLYPGGNDFVTNTRDRLDCLSFGIDFSELMNGNAAGQSTPRSNYFISANWPLGNTNAATVASQNDVFDAIKNVTGIPLVAGGVPTAAAATRWSMLGATSIIVALPSLAYPEANSKDFNRVVIITPTTAHTWATGRLYLHYNV